MLFLPIVAKHINITFLEWNENPCFNAKILGCKYESKLP